MRVENPPVEGRAHQGLEGTRLSVVAIVTVGLATGPTSAEVAGSTTRHDVLTNTADIPGLDQDHHMLEQMRVAVVLNPGARNDGEPMWVDPDRVRAQEQFEAQIDRMIGRRSGRP